MITALAIIFQLSLIVLAHELGHYFFARLSGVRVLTFNIGFGPALWSFTRGGTEYALRLFPLGGFVQLAGLDGDTGSAAELFGSKSWLRRFSIISGGALFNILLAWLIFTGLYMTRHPLAFGQATLMFVRFAADFLRSVLLFFAHPTLTDLSGPLGVLEVSAISVQQGWPVFWFCAAFLSLNLGVINLLPFPALDGGRLIFLFYELFFRRKPSPRLEHAAHALGLGLLLALIIFLSFQDIAKIFS